MAYIRTGHVGYVGDQWLAHIALYLLNKFTDSLRALVTQEGNLGFSPVTTSFLELLQCASDPKHLPLRVPPDLFDVALTKSSVEYGRAGCYLLALEYGRAQPKPESKQAFLSVLGSSMEQSTALSLLYGRVKRETTEDKWQEIMQEEPQTHQVGLAIDISRLKRFGMYFDDQSLSKISTSCVSRQLYHPFFNTSRALDPQFVVLQKLVLQQHTHTYIHTYIHTYMHTYIIHTHTHTHTHTPQLIIDPK